MNLPKISDFIEVNLVHKQFYEDPDLNYTHHMYTINDENLLIQTLKFSYHEIWNEFLTTHAIPPYNIIRCATVNLDKLNMSTDYYNEAIIQIKNDVLETLILNFHDTDYSIMNRWTTDEFHRIKLVTLPFPVSGQDLRMKTIQDIQNCSNSIKNEIFPCVEKFIQYKMNCNVPLSLHNQSLPNCTTNNDVQRFINLTAYIFDGYYDVELTEFGCLPQNCIRNEWEANQIYHVQPGQKSSLLDDLGRSDASTIIISKYSNKVCISNVLSIGNVSR